MQISVISVCASVYILPNPRTYDLTHVKPHLGSVVSFVTAYALMLDCSQLNARSTVFSCVMKGMWLGIAPFGLWLILNPSCQPSLKLLCAVGGAIVVSYHAMMHTLYIRLVDRNVQEIVIIHVGTLYAIDLGLASVAQSPHCEQSYQRQFDRKLVANGL